MQCWSAKFAWKDHRAYPTVDLSQSGGGFSDTAEFPTLADSNTLSANTSAITTTASTALKSVSIRQPRKRMLCIYCNESFVNAEQLAEHRLIHQKSRKKLRCSFCPEVFEDQEEYSHHQLEHIKERKSFFGVNIENGIGSSTTESSIPEAPRPNTQPSVQSCLSVVASLEKTTQPPIFEIQGLGNEAATNQSFGACAVTAVKIEPPDDFPCVNTVTHYLPQYQEGDWLTNMVIETIPEVSTVDIATKDISPKPKNFVCPDCDVGFDTLSRLAVHTRRCHPYTCQDCKRTYKWLDELNDHRQVYFMKPCYRWSKCPKLAFSHQKP